MNSNNTIQHLIEPALPSIKSPPQRRWRTALIHVGRISALALAWVLAFLCPVPAGAQSYTATFIQAADHSFDASSLNDLGEVAGRYFPGGGVAKPVILRDGTLAELPLLPGAIGGLARGSNNVGQVVGACFDSAGVYQACIWQNGSVNALPVLAGAVSSEAIDINDPGGVVGYASVAAGVYPDGSIAYRQDAVVWQGGSVQRIAPPYGDLEMSAQAIDASGRVAVSVYDEWMGGWMPGRWMPDVPNGLTGAVELLDFGGYAYDINEAGAVCGYDVNQGAVIWGISDTTLLGTLPGDIWSAATSINRAGTVTGTSVAFDSDVYTDTAFVATAEDGMSDLNALLNGPSTFGVITDSFKINNAGQILAWADQGWVLLTPSTLPPPLPAPMGLSSQAGNASVELSWDAVAIASGYNVKRSTVSGGPYTTIATGVAATSYVDPTAVNGMRYYYVVSALADTRESANSNETTARPMAPPVAPTALAAKVAKAKVTLTWRQSTSPEILRNRIYRSTNGGAYVAIADISAGLTWTDNSARSKTNYRYVVTAVNSISLESPASNAVSAQPK